jgi:hypothetical protein
MSYVEEIPSLICSAGQGEATYRKYKRLKLGQAYDRSSD